MLTNLFIVFFLERSFHEELNVCNFGYKNLQLITFLKVFFISSYRILLQIHSM